MGTTNDRPIIHSTGSQWITENLPGKLLRVYFKMGKTTKAENTLRAPEQGMIVCQSTHKFNLHAYETKWEVPTLMTQIDYVVTTCDMGFSTCHIQAPI